MKKTIIKLHDFIKKLLKESKSIEVEKTSFKKITNYIIGKNQYYEEEIEIWSKEILEKTGLDLNENQKDLFYLSGTKVRWKRKEQKSKEGFISGGFYINGLIDIFLYTSNFWEIPEERFQSIGQEKMLDIPTDLKWIESTTALNEPVNTPQFGCINLKLPHFPDKFFFYDCGFIYSLPFSSFEDYFEAMIASASVRCWQYFYLDPNTIIQKNKNVSYFTWSLHIDTNLDEKLGKLYYDGDAQFDRLDLIHEYLERCVRLLPESFPFLDFSHHQQYYNEFEKLYKQSKDLD